MSEVLGNRLELVALLPKVSNVVDSHGLQFFDLEDVNPANRRGGLVPGFELLHFGEVALGPWSAHGELFRRRQVRDRPGTARRRRAGLRAGAPTRRSSVRSVRFWTAFGALLRLEARGPSAAAGRRPAPASSTSAAAPGCRIVGGATAGRRKGVAMLATPTGRPRAEVAASVRRERDLKLAISVPLCCRGLPRGGRSASAEGCTWEKFAARVPPPTAEVGDTPGWKSDFPPNDEPPRASRRTYDRALRVGAGCQLANELLAVALVTASVGAVSIARSREGKRASVLEGELRRIGSTERG